MTSRRRRALGQHFLYNTAIAERMAEYADVRKTDAVIEVGPGRGIITAALAATAKKVIAIEKDRGLAGQLIGRWRNVEIITGDALELDWPRFNKLVANIPFEISSPLLFKLFQQKFKVAVLILQKEFARRLVAAPGTADYSRLSVAARYYCDSEIVGTLSRGNFRPAPKVDCAIVRLRPRRSPFATDEHFWQVVSSLFQHKRKIVKAALRAAKFGAERVARVPDELKTKRVCCCNLNDIRVIADSLA